MTELENMKSAPIKIIGTALSGTELGPLNFFESKGKKN
jgi:hypothetical protein